MGSDTTEAFIATTKSHLPEIQPGTPDVEIRTEREVLAEGDDLGRSPRPSESSGERSDGQKR